MSYISYLLLTDCLSNKILICSVCRSFSLSSHPEHLTSPSVSIEVHVTPSLVCYVMFCRSSFSVLSFYFAWSLCFPSLFELRLLNASFGIVKHIFSSILCSISVKGGCKSWIIYIVMEANIFVKAKG